MLLTRLFVPTYLFIYLKKQKKTLDIYLNVFFFLPSLPAPPPDYISIGSHEGTIYIRKKKKKNNAKRRILLILRKVQAKKKKDDSFFMGCCESWKRKVGLRNYTRPVCVCSISFFCKTSPRDHPQKGEERERKREKPINRECCSTGWQGVPSVHVLEGHRERTSAGGGRSSSCLLSFLCDMKTFTF